VTLQIELKDDKIVQMTEESGQQLRIRYEERGVKGDIFIPMSIIKAFGEVKTPLELLKEAQS
jgi:hypothetical protein